jgi:hypothetical protein
MLAFELENLLQHESHDFDCSAASPFTGTGVTGATFPFINAVGEKEGGSLKLDQNPHPTKGKYWELGVGASVGPFHCWLILNKPFYIP